MRKPEDLDERKSFIFSLLVLICIVIILICSLMIGAEILIAFSITFIIIASIMFIVFGFCLIGQGIEGELNFNFLFEKEEED